MLRLFLPDQAISGLVPLGLGNINETWRVDLADGSQRVLQRLRPTVFPDLGVVMDNVRLLTRHLNRARIPGLCFFTLCPLADGRDHVFDQEGHCWRMLTYIPHTRTLAHLRTTTQAREIGALLGRFHLLTADLDPAGLGDPLPGFHCTSQYLRRFDAVAGKRGPVSAAEEECLRIIEQERSGADLLEAGPPGLSRRIIHGDPKAANFLFAVREDRAVSLIDFDTVQPGPVLLDLGDCLRSCCNPVGETPPDPETIRCDPTLFAALLQGYGRHGGALLTPDDRAALVSAAALLCFELGLRFFADHLDGDQYFKTTRPGQNLHRAQVQFRLLRSIHEQRDVLARMVNEALG